MEKFKTNYEFKYLYILLFASTSQVRVVLFFCKNTPWLGVFLFVGCQEILNSLKSAGDSARRISPAKKEGGILCRIRFRSRGTSAAWSASLDLRIWGCLPRSSAWTVERRGMRLSSRSSPVERSRAKTKPLEPSLHFSSFTFVICPTATASRAPFTIIFATKYNGAVVKDLCYYLKI